VSTSTDGKNQQTSYTYDNLDRVTKLTYAGGITISYGYDANGNLSSMTDPTGTTSYTYDKDNRVLTKTLPGGTQLTYTYDAVGNLATFTDGGGKVSYSYDADNQLLTLTEPGGAQTTFVYNAGNERTSVSYPNGVVTTMRYDAAGHLEDITAKKGSTVLTSFSYSYINGRNATDIVTSATDNVSGNTTTNSYDTLNRLTEALVKHGSTQVSDYKYSYDWAGNRTSSTASNVQTTYSYNAANELTSTVKGSTTTTYSYDANGSETGSNGREPGSSGRQPASSGGLALVGAAVGDLAARFQPASRRIVTTCAV